MPESRDHLWLTGPRFSTVFHAVGRVTHSGSLVSTRLGNISLQVEAGIDLNHENLAEPSVGMERDTLHSKTCDRAAAGPSTFESRPSREGIAVP